MFPDEAEALRTIARDTPDSVAVYDLDGRMLYANPETERSFGRPLDAMRGRRLFDDLFPEAIGNPFHAAFLRVARTGEAEVFDHYYPPFDRWYANRITRADGQVHVVGRDVTDDVRRRRRLEALARVADAVAGDARALPEAMQAMVEGLAVVLDADCALGTLIGGERYDLVAFAARDDVSRAHLATMPRQISAASLREVIAARRVVLADAPALRAFAAATADPRFAEFDARYAPASGLLVPLAVADELLGVLVATRRGGERALHADDRALAAEVAPSVALYLAHAHRCAETARLYAEAQSARAVAETASRAKDDFLAMLGHELRNPLATMSNALRLMAMRAPDAAARERGVMERQVAHLSRLVEDLLDVARISRGKVTLRRERAALAGVLRRAAEMTAGEFARRCHRLELDAPEDLAADGDPTRLDQVFANLLSNAARYTPPGGTVRVSAARRGDALVVTVRDDGVGIAPDVLPRVFESFVQAAQGRARTDGGLGLGLTIVRELVELHGGQVTIESDGPGRGTLVTVTLPAARGDAPPAPPLRRASARQRVLVADQAADVATLLAEVLCAQGHDARPAFDGPSARRLAEGFAPELAVLDLDLPGLDGFVLAGQLRRGGSSPRLVAIAGFGVEVDPARARGAGFEAVLPRPVSLRALTELIDAPEGPR